MFATTATVLVMAGATCAAALLTASRVFGWKRIIKHATITDVTFTVGAVVVLGSTMTGALVAVMAGLLMAMFLSIARSSLKASEALSGAAQKARRTIWVDVPTAPAEADPLNVCNAPCVPETTHAEACAMRRGPKHPVLIVEAGAA